jgi:hypothetical protein
MTKLRTALNTPLIRLAPRTAGRPGPVSTSPALTASASTPLVSGPAWRSQIMNSPRWPTPACQWQPLRQHQRKYNAMAPA